MRGNFNHYYGKDNPNYKDGRKGTRLYRIYRNMLSRCNNANSPSYLRYGKRGICVCEEWAQNFVSFKDWAYNNGYSDELTIDRIDNDGDYEPKNCRWVTTKDQALNTSRNRFISIGGTTKTLTEWCEIYSINYKTVQDRLNRGWEHERAITTPIDRRWSH